jgi:hypothetical protein
VAGFAACVVGVTGCVGFAVGAGFATGDGFAACVIGVTVCVGFCVGVGFAVGVDLEGEATAFARDVTAGMDDFAVG